MIPNPQQPERCIHDIMCRNVFPYEECRDTRCRQYITNVKKTSAPGKSASGSKGCAEHWTAIEERTQHDAAIINATLDKLNSSCKTIPLSEYASDFDRGFVEAMGLVRNYIKSLHQHTNKAGEDHP